MVSLEINEEINVFKMHIVTKTNCKTQICISKRLDGYEKYVQL